MWRINKPILTAYNNMNKPSLHCVLYYKYTSTWSPITEYGRRQRWHIVVISVKKQKKKNCVNLYKDSLSFLFQALKGMEE